MQAVRDGNVKGNFVNLHVVKEYRFRFKRFSVSHAHSAMKVGVDSVLLGSFVHAKGARRILDAGCGCGILSLMCAQRFPEAEIVGLDVHLPSAAEAFGNILSSGWASRMKILLADFGEYVPDEKFDLMISNPPFYESGVTSPVSPREVARHAGRFSHHSLLKRAGELLTQDGILSIIYPFTHHKVIMNEVAHYGLRFERALFISGVEGMPPKRVAAQFTLRNNPREISESIFIKDCEGNFSKEYIELTKDFYLAF